MILNSMPTLLVTSNSTSILNAISATLDRLDEAPFWRQKTLPYCEAILSVLIPLREQKLLFDPEGKAHETLTPALFLRWCDLMSLKTLAFTIAKSNSMGKLVRIKITSETYQPIDLEILGKYLSSYTINLIDETLDFPIRNYNLHIGISDLIRKILNGNITNV